MAVWQPLTLGDAFPKLTEMKDSLNDELGELETSLSKSLFIKGKFDSKTTGLFDAVSSVSEAAINLANDLEAAGFALVALPPLGAASPQGGWDAFFTQLHMATGRPGISEDGVVCGVVIVAQGPTSAGLADSWQKLQNVVNVG